MRRIFNAKKKAIEKELLLYEKMGRIPNGTCGIIAKQFNTTLRYVENIKSTLSLRTNTGGHDQPQYEPQAESLVDRGDCLQLDQDAAQRYDVIKYFHQYRKRNKIAIGDSVTFDREFNKWIKIVGGEKLWNQIK